MAQFSADLKPSFPFLDIEPSNMELINQYADQFNHPSVLDYSSLNHFPSYMPFSNDNFFGNLGPEFPGSLVENFPAAGFAHQNNLQNDEASAAQRLVAAGNPEFQETKKGIAMDISESSSEVSNPPVSKTGIKRKNVTID